MNQVPPGGSRSILIADSNTGFLDSIHLDPKALLLPPITAKTSQEAQSALVKRDYRLIALVVCSTLDQQGGLSVIRCARIHRPSLPIYFLYEEASPFSEEEQKALGIQKRIKKPLTYSQIADHIVPNSVDFAEEEGLQNQEGGAILLDQEFSSKDLNFIPIRAIDFLAGTKSNFDLFVRLASGRYLKILKAQEIFEPERLGSYLKKGIRFFYLEKSAHANYVKYYDKIADAIIKSPRFTPETRLKIALNHGQETIHFLHKSGLNQGTLQFAQSFVKNVEALVQTSHLHKSEKISSLIDNFNLYDHGVSVTLVASLVGKALSFENDRAIQLIGLASLFHDIGLVGLPREFEAEDESQLSEAQRAQYRTHPLLGAQILEQLDLDLLVIQAVAQHHERRNGKGYPLKLGSGTINRVSELVGISDEFIRMVKLTQENPNLDVFRAMETDVLDGFSYAVVEAFQSVFFPKKRSHG